MEDIVVFLSYKVLNSENFLHCIWSLDPQVLLFLRETDSSMMRFKKRVNVENRT